MKSFSRGFTIVELLVVIVVIAILAAITIVAYNGIVGKARDDTIKADLSSFTKAVENDKTTNGTYPAISSAANGGKGLISASGNTVDYNVDGTYSLFCLQVSRSGSQSYFTTQASLTPIAGTCSGTNGMAAILDGSFIQTTSTANCPTTRTRLVDARDSHSYWVQKLADNRCWMLTNLAYAGGGTNTYSDVKSLTNSTGVPLTFTTASYFLPTTGGNVTTEPASPSTSTDGGNTNPQYGYLYNWCGAMGGQATAACANASTPVLNTVISVCPSGWRLPTGNGGEFAALNNAINGGATNSSTGLRNTWLAQWGGMSSSGMHYNSGSEGDYWSSTMSGPDTAYRFAVWSAGAQPAGGVFNKDYGSAVRCVAV